MGGQMAWAHGHNTTRSAGNGLNGFNPWECSSSLFRSSVVYMHFQSSVRRGGKRWVGGQMAWAQMGTMGLLHVQQVMASMGLIHGRMLK